MTFSRWLKRFGGPIGKAVSSFSLIAAGLALAADYGQVAQRLRQAGSANAKKAIYRELSEDQTIDRELYFKLQDFLSERSYGPTEEQIERMVELRAFAQNDKSEAEKVDPKAAAKRIKASPLFRDPGEQEESNWFAKGFRSLGEWIQRLLSRTETPRVDAGSPQIGGFLVFLRILLWAVLGGLFVFFLYLALRHFRWKSGLERQAKALLTEDEPVLTRDEYLDDAARLEADGRYREAVRSLYLASLLLFDERGVARFLKGQTNWEHLRRIQASPALPEGLDFQPATRKFDVVWYGMKVNGPADLDAMREWYGQISDALRRKAA